MASAVKLPMPQFVVEKVWYGLHNAAPKAVHPKWASRTFTIPAADEIGQNPICFPNGQPIPGTVLISDGYTLNAEGHIPIGGPPNWIASEAIRNILGYNPDTGESLGDWARAGVSFMPNNPTPDVVAAVVADGKQRYQESLTQWAMDTIGGYERAHEKAKIAGVEPKPFGRDYQHAVQILNKAQVAVTQVANLLPSEAEIDDELEFLAFAKAKAMEMANKAASNLNVNHAELAEELLKDPEVLEHLKKKYRIQEIGAAPPANKK